MYKKDYLTLTAACFDTHDDWDEVPHYHVYGHFDVYPHPVVYLQHSCDEWVIGGAAQVQAMIDDLTALLAQLKTL